MLYLILHNTFEEAYGMPEDRRVQKSKTIIINTFIALAQTKEISKITITDIANQANIHRKTFYTHFGSIEALLIYIQESLLFDFNDSLQKEIKQSKLKKSNFTYFILQFIDDHIEIIRMLYSNYDKKFIEHFIKKNQNILENILPPVTKNQNTNFKIYATSFLVGGLITIIEKWIDDKSISKDEIENVFRAFESISADFIQSNDL